MTVYLASGVMGGLVQVLAGLVLPRYLGGFVVGASAAAFGLVAAFALLFPEGVILLFFVIPLRAKHLLVLSGLLAVLGLVAPQSRDPNAVHIADAAHLGGMVAGLLFIRYAIHWHWAWPRFPRRKDMASRRLVKVGSGAGGLWRRGRAGSIEDLPPEEFLSREVDPILDKISAQGIQSLTERERHILEAAREKMASAEAQNFALDFYPLAVLYSGRLPRKQRTQKGSGRMRTTKCFVWPAGAGQLSVLFTLGLACSSLAQSSSGGAGVIPIPTNSTIPIVTIRATVPTATWSGKPGVFTVSRAGNAAPPLNVYYEISGTASNGVDYQAINNWVQIPSGVLCGDVLIKPVNHGQTDTRTVTLTLTNSPLMSRWVSPSTTASAPPATPPSPFYPRRRRISRRR